MGVSMREPVHEEKTARHLDYLSEAMSSGAQLQVRQLINSLSAAEIGDLLESLPPTFPLIEVRHRERLCRIAC